MPPLMSVLFRKTSKLAPARRCASRSDGVVIAAVEAYLLEQQCMKLLATIANACSIDSIHHPDQRIRLLKVVSPIGADRLLASNIPDVEFIPVGSQSKLIQVELL